FRAFSLMHRRLINLLNGVPGQAALSNKCICVREYAFLKMAGPSCRGVWFTNRAFCRFYWTASSTAAYICSLSSQFMAKPNFALAPSE
ncbi:MAG: hypothetical protein DRH70_06585, partial [Candidatus Coatesbacteria bacterium]